ncbi:restriction endonuclease subunit S [Aeromonas caviae]|uniref:restriction endonuclease subunit S n=1 Tax=Aeromonas caviae TaxID=648 RepID=UPI0028697A97|nr:restriction endonuclease subunit S [Aeromonas caviae]WMX35166.1 restriction endonuclease subunit S [Aeromonas caviae]
MTLTAMPKYYTYKDSGVEGIGKIPSTWKLKKAKWLFSKVDRPVRSEDEIVTCFRDGQVTLRSNRRTEGFTNALKEHGYQGIRVGDLVIHAMDAFAGAIGVSDSNGKATPVYSVCVPRNEKQVNPFFYAYYLRDLALSGYIVSLAKGIRERSTDFRFSDFSQLFLPLPDLDEQTAIAKFLDKKTIQIDEAITIKKQQISLLNERKQMLIQQAVTQGLDSNVPMKDSGVAWIGKIPAHWEVRRGKFLFKKMSRPVRKEDDVVTCFRDGQVTLRTNRRTEGFTFALKEHGYQGIRVGDLVIHAMDAFAGAIGVSDADGKSTPVYSVCMSIDASKTCPFYYAHYLRNLASMGFIESLAKGIRERSTDFRFNDFAELFLPLPPKPEQQRIVTFIKNKLERIDSGVNHWEKQIESLKQYKTTLINSAITGKVKVV